MAKHDYTKRKYDYCGKEYFANNRNLKRCAAKTNLKNSIMTYEYKGYIGVANYNEKRDDWTGEVTNTTDLVLFYSNSILELKYEFIKSVNRYIESFQNLSK